MRALTAVPAVHISGAACSKRLVCRDFACSCDSGEKKCFVALHTVGSSFGLLDSLVWSVYYTPYLYYKQSLT